jgi:XTP/dITP diphosphohydrolase/tetrapyrrole methylase family protein/MazG family protein/ATP diphosphatase
VTDAPDAAGKALLGLDEVTRRLRRDCPWDRAQDERSIVPHTVEEAYELAEAAHSGDDRKLADELGDVLFQVHFLALLLEERGGPGLAGVARGATEKLVRRHPHVFGEGNGTGLEGLPTEARTAAEVRENWDAIKREERGTGEDAVAEAGGGASGAMPALIYARKVQRRAEGGSDRARPEPVVAELRALVERAGEVVAGEHGGAPAQEQTEHGSQALYESVGALLFATVELARAVGVDPEVALRLATDRFRRERAGAGEGR